MNLTAHVTSSGAKGYVYPTIRLPTHLQHLIGKEVSLTVEQLSPPLNPSTGGGEIHRSGVQIPSGPLNVVPFRNQELSNFLSKKHAAYKKVVITYDDGVDDGQVEHHTIYTGKPLEEALYYTELQLQEWMNQWGASSKSTQGWVRQVAKLIHATCSGTITAEIIQRFMKTVAERYSPPSQAKYYLYARNFVEFLARGSRERHSIAELLLEHMETPRATKSGIRSKKMTERVVSPQDILNVLASMTKAYEDGELTEYRYQHHYAFVTCAFLSGQRVMDMALLTADEWREGLKQGYVSVPADKDKIRFPHVFPIHESMREPLKKMLEHKSGEERLFNHTAVMRFVHDHPVPLERTKQPFQLSDTRKAFTQYGTQVGFTQLYKNYIQSHDVGGVVVRHYESVEIARLIEEYQQKYTVNIPPF